MPSTSNPNLLLLEIAVDSLDELVDEVRQSEAELRNALAKRFRDLLKNNRFVDAVSGHMPSDGASQARVPIVLDRMTQIAEIQ